MSTDEHCIDVQPDAHEAETKDGDAIVHAINQMGDKIVTYGDKIVTYYMKSVDIMERVYAHQLRNPGPTINIVEEHRNWNTYHVGGLLCNEGQSPGGVLSITAHLRPLMADVAIVVGSPSATPLPDACLTKINGWAMNVATAKLLVATVQQAIRDVEDATSKGTEG